jgi:hypothetical protein
VIERTPVTINANATDDVAVASVRGVVLTATAPPYQYMFTAATTPGALTISATATDFGNNVTMVTATVQVIPDPLTTVSGRVVDGSKNPVTGASVSVLFVQSHTRERHVQHCRRAHDKVTSSPKQWGR